jgi:LAO/AO transport system kinase
MEIADIYVMNKAHLPGASRSISELESLLRYGSSHERGWSPRIVAITDPGEVSALDQTIEAHRLSMSGERLARRRAKRERLWLSSMIARRVEEIIDGEDAPDATRRERYRRLLAALPQDDDDAEGEPRKATRR